MSASLRVTVFLALVALIVIFSVSLNSRNSIFIKEFAYVIAGVLSSLVLGVLCLTRGRLLFHRIPVAAPAALVLVGVLMLVMQHAGPVNSVNGPFTLASFAALALLAALGASLLEPRDAEILGLLVTGFSVMLFLYAILQSLGVNLFAWDAGLTRTGRASGSLGNPNLLGSFSAAMIPFGAVCVYRFISGSGGTARSGARRTTLKFLVAGFFVLLGIVSVVVSGTRGSLLGVGGGTLFLLVWVLSRKELPSRNRWVAMVLAAACMVLVVVPMASRLAEIRLTEEQTGTAQVRKVIWSGGWAMFHDRPLLGWGPGSFQIVFPQYRDPSYSLLGVSHNTLHAHCEYLEILCDLGLAGLLLWAVFVYAMARRLPGANLFQAGAAAGAFSMLSENLVSVSLRWPPTAWLFTFFCMIFLVRQGTPAWKPRRIVQGALGVFFVGVAVFLAVFAFRAYPAFLEASRLVFIGKDYHLTSAEAAMNAASHHAQTYAVTRDPGAAHMVYQSWSGAILHADSAIALCTRAAQRYPDDLGAYYALGSAYLTRALLANPLDRNVATALGTQRGWAASLEKAQTCNRLGLETYRTLTLLAPNYAETHHNMAIGYYALGEVYPSLEELYLAWRLHAHRRDTYISQAYRLQRIAPDSPGGALLVWKQDLELLRSSLAPGLQARADAVIRSMSYTAWFLLRASPSPDSLYGSLQEVTEEALPGAWPTLDSAFHAMETPEALWLSALERIRTGGEGEGLSLLYRFHNILLAPGSMAPTHWPGLGAGFSVVPEAAERMDWTDEASEALFQQAVQLLSMEHMLDSSLELLQPGTLLDVRSGVQDSLGLLLRNLGGPRAALRASLRTPWIPGSMLGQAESLLTARSSLHPQDVQYPLLLTRFYFLVVSSFWWGSPYFVADHNQYLLERLFASRDAVVALAGPNAPVVLSRGLDREMQRIAGHLTPANASVMEELKKDLVLGTPPL